MQDGGGPGEADRRFRQAFENAPTGMALLGLDTRFLLVNPSLGQIVGHSPDDLLTMTSADVTHPNDVDADAELARRLLAGTVRTYSIEKRYLHAAGHEVWIALSVSLVRDDDGTPRFFVNQVEDITARRRQEQELLELALVDELTGLHNRRSFMLLGEQALKEASRARRPVIAVFVDVDQLKAINDRFGHAEGDRALRLVADGLRAACRSSDIIGRLSGDEFAVLLAEAREPDGLEGRVRRRIADAAATATTTTTGTYPLSVSIGIAQCTPGEHCRLDELFDRADRAMYAEKAAKRRAPSSG